MTDVPDAVCTTTTRGLRFMCGTSYNYCIHIQNLVGCSLTFSCQAFFAYFSTFVSSVRYNQQLQADLVGCSLAVPPSIFFLQFSQVFSVPGRLLKQHTTCASLFVRPTSHFSWLTGRLLKQRMMCVRFLSDHCYAVSCVFPLYQMFADPPR